MKNTTLVRPNETIGLVPGPGQKITLQQRLLYASLLFISRQQGDQDRYQAFLADIAALVGIAVQKHSKYLRDSLDDLRALTFRLTVEGEEDGQVIYDDISIGYIDRPGFRVRRGVQTRVIWSLDPELKKRLLNPTSNFTLMPLNLLAVFKSSSAVALAEICFQYKTNFAGKALATTGRKPIEYWYPRILGHQVGKDYQYKYFKRDVLKRIIEEVNTVAPFTVSLNEIKVGRSVKELEFLIAKKESEIYPEEVSISNQVDQLDEAEVGEIDSESRYLISKIMSEVGGSRKDALEILRKYTDRQYVTKHLYGHAEQMAKGYKPKNALAIFKSRLKDDWSVAQDHQVNTHLSQKPFVITNSVITALQTQEDINIAIWAKKIDEMAEQDREQLIEKFLAAIPSPSGQDLFRERGYENRFARGFLISWAAKSPLDLETK